MSEAAESGRIPTLANHKRKTLERPKVCAQVKALVLEGLSDAKVAAKVGCTRQAITHFRHRHAAELQAAVAEVERQIEDYAITRKVARMADAQMRRDLLDEVRQARAKGGTGLETGIVAQTYKMIGSGEDARLVAEYKVDTAMLAEWRANDKQVAEELDQLPRAKPGDINIDARQIHVALKWATDE